MEGVGIRSDFCHKLLHHNGSNLLSMARVMINFVTNFKDPKTSVAPLTNHGLQVAFELRFDRIFIPVSMRINVLTTFVWNTFPLMSSTGCDRDIFKNSSAETDFKKLRISP
jgi:hypothetical protein